MRVQGQSEVAGVLLYPNAFTRPKNLSFESESFGRRERSFSLSLQVGNTPGRETRASPRMPSRPERQRKRGRRREENPRESAKHEAALRRGGLSHYFGTVIQSAREIRAGINKYTRERDCVCVYI